ncbi:TonB-dependent receptor plug domain-containing protein [Pedobacter panaciterrae]
MKIHLLFAFFLCLYILPFEVVAQQNGKITGTVRDDKQTLPSVSVLLYSAKDSVLVTTGMTDGEGKFNLPAVPGAYYVLSTFVGYNKVKTPVFELKGSTYELPAIVLKENTNKLNEVSITASKPVLERKGDKLIFNIEAIPSAAGLNGLEVLRKAPGVTIDHNENISLASKGNVLVTIDGKQTYLSSAEVVSLLKSMPSSEIESIEIINNPGARYDANSTGGIINIKTKKSLAIGFNGNLTLGVGYNKRLQANPGINLNYRRQFFNVFGSYDYNRWPFQENLTIDRVTPGMNSKQLYFSQRNRDTSVFASNNFKIGTDFFLTKNHTIGVLLKGNLNGFDQNGFSRITIGDSFAKPDSILQTPGKNSTDRKNFSYNINYKGILDTAGQEITIDADYSTFNGDNKASFVNRFFLPDGTFLRTDRYIGIFRLRISTLKPLKQIMYYRLIKCSSLKQVSR